MTRSLWKRWSVVVLLPVDLFGQRRRSVTVPRIPSDSERFRSSSKRSANREENAAFNAGRKAHWKAQDRATRKRWRAQRRASKRMRRGGGPDSWYQGMFRSGHPIPWTRRAANKVGNLFKRKRKRRPIDSCHSPPMDPRGCSSLR